MSKKDVDCCDHVHSEFTRFTVISNLAGFAVVSVGWQYLAPQTRLQLMSCLVSLAGGTYIYASLGATDLVGSVAVLACGFLGLTYANLQFLAAGWAIHGYLDYLHHRADKPLVRFIADSASGCAFIDAFFAAWLWFGAPALVPL